MSELATRGWIGRALPRAEDERFLRGEAQYVGDLSLPGMLHAAFVRSVYAHGRLLGVDADAARALPGVRAVLTASEMEGLAPFPLVGREGAELAPVAHPVLARGRVRYVGEPVALVVADTPEQAADAAEWVAVEVEELPALVDPTAAEGAPPLHDEAPDNVDPALAPLVRRRGGRLRRRPRRRPRARPRAAPDRGPDRAACRPRRPRRRDRRAHALALRTGHASPARRAEPRARAPARAAAGRRPRRRGRLREQGRPAGGDGRRRGRRAPDRPAR